MARSRTGASPAPPRRGGDGTKEAGDKPEYRVETLAKGLRLLSLFDEQRPSRRVTDLATTAGLPMPTVYRIVMTLTAEGHLDQLPSGEYRPPEAVAFLGRAGIFELTTLVGYCATLALQLRVFRVATPQD